MVIYHSYVTVYQRVGLHNPLPNYIKILHALLILPQRHLSKLRHSP